MNRNDAVRSAGEAMNRNDTDNAMEVELVGGPWARRVWLAGCLLLAAFLFARSVPGSPLRAKPVTAHRLTPLAASQASLASAAPAAPATDPEVRQVGRFLVRPTNIEDITDKDLVLAKDPETGELAAKPVVQTSRRVSDHLRILRIRNADGTEQTIETTNEHPFWVPSRGWVDAGKLALGDSVTHSDGLRAELLASTYEPHPEGMPVYNFEVADLHCYFVSASPRAPPVLVHNSSKCFPPVVIGEGMDRVRAFAGKIGADVFEVGRRVSDDELMALNKVWIHRAINEGRTIIDIGPKTGRVGPLSKFYQMELDAILARGYRWRIPASF